MELHTFDKCGGKKILMYKAKTQAWIDKVIGFHGELEGQKIIDS